MQNSGYSLPKYDVTLFSQLKTIVACHNHYLQNVIIQNIVKCSSYPYKEVNHKKHIECQVHLLSGTGRPWDAGFNCRVCTNVRKKSDKIPV